MRKLYKILLVEDELEVLEAMIKTVNWNQLGFSDPIGCKDGREAIDMLMSGYAPHVIITDIYMPFVSGLEVADYAKQHLPDAIVVILSGYDEFEYAQKAVKLQIYDYVLKPITPKALKTLMLKIKDEMDVKQNASTDQNLIVKSHFFNQLTTQKMDNATIDRLKGEYNIFSSQAFHTVITFDVDLSNPEDVGERNYTEQMRYGLFNITEELAELNDDFYIFLGSDGKVKAFIGGATYNTCLDSGVEFGKKVVEIFSQQMHITSSCGVGNPTSSFSKVYLSHAQSLEALSQRFFKGKSSLLIYQTLKIDSLNKDFDYAGHEQQLQKGIKNFSHKETALAIENMTDDMMRLKLSFDKSVTVCQKLMIALMKLVREIVDRPHLKDLEEQWENISFYHTFSLKEQKEIMLSLCKEAFNAIEFIKADTSTIQMIKAEQYINDNYSDQSLALNSVTEYLAVSISYFSVNFKARTGSTFTEYLINLRMTKAKQILSTTNRRTYEVASDVGFSDPHYFSSSFKKFTGLSPKEYREQN